MTYSTMLSLKMVALFLMMWPFNFQTVPKTEITCVWHSSSMPNSQASCVLLLSKNNQEIENQFITNSSLYARALQYLNYDIAGDVYLCIPGRTDSVAAIAASYPRQYGNTGHSSVLLVFPVPSSQLRDGCHITFRGDKFETGTRRFFFTDQDMKQARRGRAPLPNSPFTFHLLLSRLYAS
ncbi:hypothetical protein [Hymenobacter terrigena]